jgi:DNA-binding response OmpR family regulator
VLVVDDDPLIRETVAWALEDAGCAVLQAEDGQRALQAIGARPRS